MSWDGKMYNKYKIEHTDGTPLKGKKYFVLRLDSDDPIEAARVARAMRAYEDKPRNCDRFAYYSEAVNYWHENVECADVNGCFDVWLFEPAAERKGESDVQMY